MALISVIVAADEHGGIGRAGGLPWHLPEDLKRFKRLTMGKPIVMGRSTWDSIGRPLPGRHNIVITRQAGLVLPGCTVVGSFATACEAALAADRSAEPPLAQVPEEICVIGGAQVYAQALPLTEVIHLTRVHTVVDADTFMPALDAADWRETACESHAADERHAWSYSFVTLERIRATE